MSNDQPAADPIEATDLERAADWRIKKLGENPSDAQSAVAAKLLQTLAGDVRRLPGSPAYVEYLAILNWLGEFDVMDEFTERANDYRARFVRAANYFVIHDLPEDKPGCCSRPRSSCDRQAFR